MNTKEELLSSLPTEYTRESAEQWVLSVLAVTPVTDVVIENQGHDKRVNLPPIEVDIYKEVVQKFGAPKVLPKENSLVGDPNIPLIFLWALSHKYRLGLRYSTEVTNAGVLKYEGF